MLFTMCTYPPGRTLLASLIALASSLAGAAQYQAVVSPRAQNNEFTAIAAALASAPAGDTPFTIMVFDECKIIARHRGDIAPPYGYLTAPSTKISSPYGLIFLHSQLLKEPGAPAKSFALGRPWHPTTVFNDGRYADPVSFLNRI